MQLIESRDLDKVESVELKLAGGGATRGVVTPAADLLKIFVSGELAAGGRDRRCLLRVNNLAFGYTSFVVMEGHATMGEWEGSGLYLGRNGWGLDASLSAEYTLASRRLVNKIVGHGMATFSNGNNSILGYHAHGFVLGGGPISRVDLLFQGGLFTGNITLFRF